MWVHLCCINYAWSIEIYVPIKQHWFKISQKSTGSSTHNLPRAPGFSAFRKFMWLVLSHYLRVPALLALIFVNSQVCNVRVRRQNIIQTAKVYPTKTGESVMFMCQRPFKLFFSFVRLPIIVSNSLLFITYNQLIQFNATPC